MRSGRRPPSKIGPGRADGAVEERGAFAQAILLADLKGRSAGLRLRRADGRLLRGWRRRPGRRARIERVEPALAASADGLAAASWARVVSSTMRPCEEGLDVIAADRGGGPNAAGGGGAGDFGDDEERLARQRVGVVEAGGAAIGEAVAAGGAGPLRDAVGIGAGEHGAEIEVAGREHRPSGAPACARRRRGANDRGGNARDGARDRCRRRQGHARSGAPRARRRCPCRAARWIMCARRGWSGQFRERPALGGDPAVGIERFERAAEGRRPQTRRAWVADRGRPARPGRRRPKLARSRARPARSALRISGVSNGWKAAGLRFGPEAIGDARRGAAGAAAALIGGGAGDALR